MDDVSTSAAEQVSFAQSVTRVTTRPGSPHNPSVVEAARALVAKPLEDSRARPRRREISGADEAALSWFFGQGLSIYEKSTFGPIVEKIQMDGCSSATCATCGGAGILDDGGIRLEDKCQECGGGRLGPHKTGKKRDWCLGCHGLGRVQAYEVDVEHGGWCPDCKGSGARRVRRRDSGSQGKGCRLCSPDPVTVKQAYISDDESERAEFRTRYRLITARVPQYCCWNCCGTGEEPVTVERTHDDEDSGGVIGNDAALTRFAITSRRADAVKAISPALHAALEAFYGDVGQRWALASFGRLFALYHLTPAGKTLARAAIPSDSKPVASAQGRGTKAARAKTFLEKLEAHWAAIGLDPGDQREELIKKAAWLEDKRPKEKPKKAKIKRSGEDHNVELNAQERIGVQANLQLTQPNENRKNLLEKAREQADELYVRAAGAWNSVTISKSDKAAAARLLANLARLGHDALASKLQLSAPCSSVEIDRAKESMSRAGYLEEEIALAFESLASEMDGGDR